jgi:anti-anti-sigma factor
MDLTQSMRDGTLVVRIEGEALDATSSQQFKRQVMEALQQHQTYKLVFDLSRLKFIDSSGLGAFLSLLRHVNSHDGDLKLAGMGESVRTMFQIVRMHKLFEIHGSVEECLHSFASHRG